MWPFVNYKCYALYFPTGYGNVTAGHQLAAATTMKSLQKKAMTTSVRWILGKDGLSNFKRASCELNEQSVIRVDSHAMGKKDSWQHWTGTCTKKGVINAFTRREYGSEFRVRSTTGNISISFGKAMKKVGPADLGMSSLAKGMIPAMGGIEEIFGMVESTRQGGRAGVSVKNDMSKIVFYMEALQGVSTPLSISCPPEGVTLNEIAGHLIRQHKFPTVEESFDANLEYND